MRFLWQVWLFPQVMHLSNRKGAGYRNLEWKTVQLKPRKREPAPRGRLYQHRGGGNKTPLLELPRAPDSGSPAQAAKPPKWSITQYSITRCSKILWECPRPVHSHWGHVAGLNNFLFCQGWVAPLKKFRNTKQEFGKTLREETSRVGFVFFNAKYLL